MAILAVGVLVLAMFNGCASRTKSQPPPRTLPAQTTFWGINARILDYGTYTNATQDQVRAFHPDIPNKTLTFNASLPVFIKTTDNIPGVLNTRFGFSFELIGLPPGQRAELMLKTSHPAIRSPDGRVTVSHFWMNRPRADARGVVRSCVGYQFEEPYEIAPGDWIMEAFLGGLPALKQTFHVSAPKGEHRKAH